LQVCTDGQVNQTFRSRPLLPLAWEEFSTRKRPARVALRDLLRPDLELADFRATEVAPGGTANQTLVLCVDGNEARPWQDERDLLRALNHSGHAVVVIDPRGVGPLRPNLAVRGHDYADPLVGVEANIAYNAFLVGKSLLGMRVTDVSAAVRQFAEKWRPARIVLCGRSDAALVACLAAATDPGVTGVAVEGLPLSFVPFFDGIGRPVNAASILPGLLRDFGDVADILAAIAPRKVLVSAGVGELARRSPSVEVTERSMVKEPGVLLDWLAASPG
jgi:pimeloyl-ACP methyl ester carboxylesterase